MNQYENRIQLSQLVNTESPEAVLEEVKNIYVNHFPVYDFQLIRKVFEDFIKLYSGKYIGYRGSTTPYHDVSHTTHVFLAFARLLDGYMLDKEKFSREKVNLGLIVSLFHDAGYIAREEETALGAGYIHVRVDRGISFIKEYLKSFDFVKTNFMKKSVDSITESAVSMIKCTDIYTDVSEIDFPCDEDRTIAYLLGTADLIGQMAARNYLERLICLYEEFNAADFSNYKSEFDFLKKAVVFFNDKVHNKLNTEFKGLYRYSRLHFKNRYGIDEDLYITAITDQITYLEKILERYPEGYKEKLRRFKPDKNF